MGRRVSDRSFDRVVNFSDAIVAIAITLLVLPLTDLVTDGSESVVGLVRENSGEFHAFFLSFLLVALYWVKHHQIWGHIQAYDAVLLWVNIAWLMLIVLLPFASGLIAESGFADGSGTAYLALMAGLSGLLGLMAWLVSRQTELQKTPVPAGFFEAMVSRAIVLTIFFLGDAVVALFFPVLANWLLLLLIPLSFWHRLPE